MQQCAYTCIAFMIIVYQVQQYLMYHIPQQYLMYHIPLSMMNCNDPMISYDIRSRSDIVNII